MADQDRSKQDEGARPRSGDNDQGARKPARSEDKSSSNGQRPTRANDTDDR